MTNQAASGKPKSAGPHGRRPNIIAILADDMGFSDIGCFGSEIRTPNLDALAEGGVRFTQMYNCARCCPSRASLLTGLYPHQAGIGHMMGNYGVPEYQGYLRDDCVTIAEVLKGGGYRTGLSGKWHVGGAYPLSGRETWRPGSKGHPIPTDRGFDLHYGTLDGAGSYYNPHSLMEDGRFVSPKADEDFYYTDSISDHAVSMIDDFSTTPEPFFLYLAYTAPHWPLHARPEDIARYRGSYAGGWDKMRDDRYRRLVESGIIKNGWDLSPRDGESHPWADEKEKDWEDARMAVYAAQVDAMDQGIGRVVEALKKNGQYDNTVILFMSDNGGCAEYLEENGWVDQYVCPQRDGTPVHIGNNPSFMPGGEDTYMSYDLPWANASNTPFRYFKHWVHEGGISTPMIVSWPSGIRNPGSIHTDPVNVVDLLPTFADLSDSPYPSNYRGRAIQPTEGESFAPVLAQGEWKRKRPIFWEHEGNCAVRDGKWKLVKRYPGDWELYDMDADRTELHDIILQNQTVAARMISAYGAWAERIKVRPWGDKGKPVLG